MLFGAAALGDLFPRPTQTTRAERKTLSVSGKYISGLAFVGFFFFFFFFLYCGVRVYGVITHNSHLHLLFALLRPPLRLHSLCITLILSLIYLIPPRMRHESLC